MKKALLTLTLSIVFLCSPIFHAHYIDYNGDSYTTHWSIAQNIEMDISEHVFTLPISFVENII